MAVEARHINPFCSQLINRNLMDNNDVQLQGNMFPSINPHLSQQQIQFVGSNNNNNLFATTTRLSPEQNQFSYNPEMMYCSDSSLQAAKISINTDHSGLSYINSRKRSRDAISAVDNEEQLYNTEFQNPNYSSSVLGELDLLPQIQKYQFDIDTVISQYTKKIRLELEERQKKARLLLSSISEGIVTKNIKEKEAQILKMGKINLALQEKVKNLYLENQLWRDLAQTNEATANSLRSNLEQVLSLHVSNGERRDHVEDDLESCCGSNDDVDVRSSGGGVRDAMRLCKMCGEREPCVMLLPCRHLCLCGGCGGGSRTVKACPVCNSSMNATLHVNMDAS